MPSKKKDTADQLTLRSMRAAAIDRFGGPEVLSIHNLPEQRGRMSGWRLATF